MIQNRGIPVRLPAAATAAPLDRSDAATITLGETGEIFFDRERVDLAGLGMRLDALKAASPDPQVFLGGAEAARLGSLVEVLDLLRSRGIVRVALETRAPRGDAEP
jgi:biopolymer transport protein ExbD